MAGITAIGSTFNLPNYHGELLNITPVDTPLLSLSGGLNSGGQSADTEFEWSEFDLRDPEIRPRLEGADAPNPEARVRSAKSNIVQIFHEAVATTYTKQAAVERYAADSLNTGSSGSNAVRNEHAWQVEQSLIQIARDVNYVFWHSTYHKPTDNTTARRTRGLLQAIETNRSAAGEVTGVSTATDTVTSASHGLSDGDKVVFTDTGASSAIRADRVYYVVSSASGTFKVAATPGGTPITIGTATVSYVEAGTPLTVDTLNVFMQGVWDNGGISQQETATLFVPSRQKRAITAAYAAAYGQADAMAGTRNVGGLDVTTVETDFGTLNLVLERALPADAVALVDLSQINPVFLSIPGKGVLFEEELAKTGATDKTQIYGELGLKYGDERRHGVLRGLAV
ncbi:DUF5309 family protein [Pseudonocardia sp. NPDC049154]|uniref:SU10 major capsid protein n=1 Tax=Pseudonocardia sp. NPDC049154 TaxID=3155501 RepID=UPI0034077A77